MKRKNRLLLAIKETEKDIQKNRPTKLLVRPENLDDALKLLGERDAEAKQKNPFTTPKQMWDDLKHHFDEPPKDNVGGLDLVNKPPHYTTGGIDFLDYAEAKGLTENAYLFNVVKYVSRAGKKVGVDPLEDLRKAEFYLKREIARRERA